MKNRSKAKHAHYPYCLSRIVIKLRSGNYFRRLKTSLQQGAADIKINRLFTSVTEQKILRWIRKARKLDAAYEPPDFLSYYAISGFDEKTRDGLLQIVLKGDSAELAYVETAPTYPPAADSIKHNGKCQGYLDPAPVGINARYAWGIKGGNGNGKVKFIDIEQGWLTEHESITVNKLSDTGSNHSEFQDHGAGVLGIIMMKGTSEGKGITPNAKGYIVSQWRPDGSFNDADAIMTAISHLKFGDILLLESQTSGAPADDKVWPIEIQEATFQVIRLATALGIIVIEAGGNGDIDEIAGNDLDLFELNRKKILDPEGPDFRDSGAIIVAAASDSVPHRRMHYSNFGKRINCYAWGENVFTAGNHPRSSGWAINLYNESFGGTSSASAIIAGVAIAVQNVAETNKRARFGPKEMRYILSSDSYGTPSANGRSKDKIGVMPDLKKIIDRVLKNRKVSTRIKR